MSGLKGDSQAGFGWKVRPAQVGGDTTKVRTDAAKG